MPTFELNSLEKWEPQKLCEKNIEERVEKKIGEKQSRIDVWKKVEITLLIPECNFGIPFFLHIRFLGT